jgi:uncharacterized protein YraI
MALRNKLLAGGLAALAMVATTAAASAAPAFATGNVNVRSGPGTGYPVVDAVRRGERVDVQYCRGSWCFIEKRGPDGWVSANYLDRGGGGWHDDDGYNPRPPRPPRWDDDYYPPRPPHWNPPPPRPPHWGGGPRPHYPQQPGANFCYNGPNGYFCVGS